MTTDGKIRDKKLQYYINREEYQHFYDKNKLDKYEYLTVEEILLSNQSRMIEQAKFTYSLLGKAAEKQAKAIENQSKKQV